MTAAQGELLDEFDKMSPSDQARLIETAKKMTAPIEGTAKFDAYSWHASSRDTRTYSFTIHILKTDADLARLKYLAYAERQFDFKIIPK